MVDYFANIAAESKIILDRQYEYISKMINEALFYLDKWNKSELNRLLSRK